MLTRRGIRRFVIQIPPVPYELGIIGAGNMAEAIVRGVLNKGVLRAEQIIAADVSPQRRELFERELHVRAVDDNLTVGRASAKEAVASRIADSTQKRFAFVIAVAPLYLLTTDY